MPASNPFAQLFVSHHLGDYLIQTDYQALNKAGGLGDDGKARPALLAHGLTYRAAFLPALVAVRGDPVSRGRSPSPH